MKKLFLTILFTLVLGCVSKVHQLKFEVVQLYCFDKGNLDKEIIFNYMIINNYDKEMKYINAKVIVKDMFDKKILNYKILSKAFVGPNTSKLFKSGIDVTYGDECSKLSNVKFEDLKIEFEVEQIAFSDNTVIKF